EGQECFRVAARTEVVLVGTLHASAQGAVFIRQAILKSVKLERHILDNGATRLPQVILDVLRERLEILNNIFSSSLIQEAMVYRDLSIEPVGFPSTEATIDVIWCLYPSLMTTVRRRA